MGLFKKIFKPVAKVLDKVIPNEIKPALPFAAAFAPFIAPSLYGSAASGLGSLLRIGSTGGGAFLGGGLNILGQLSQEGSEGDINALSAGLGALQGAMAATPSADFTAMTTKGRFGLGTAPDAITGGPMQLDRIMEGRSLLTKAKDLGLTGLAKGSDILQAGIDKPFSPAGLKAATIPAATATGDVMEAEARRLNKQAIIDEALGTLDEGFSSADAAQAIRLSMLQYGFGEDEITETIESAGYKAGGRVGFRFGGIDKAIEMVEKETVEEGKEGIMMAANEDPLLVEEYNKYVFDLMEQRPNAKPMSFQDFKRMIKAGKKEGGRVGLQEGGVLAQILPQANQITIRPGFQPFLGRPAFLPLQQPQAVFPRLNQLEQGVNRAEQNLRNIRERLGNEQRLSALSALQQAPMSVGLQPTNMLSISEMQSTLRGGGDLQGMKEGGLMDLGGKEMDLRGGGFVPIGKKEKADDVPARLSKNEFVMTADAVRAAGGGSVNKGAKRMYNLMNNLEARA